MKKIFSAMIILSVIFSVSACGSSEPVKIHTLVFGTNPKLGDYTKDYYLISKSVKGSDKNNFNCKVLVKVSDYGKKSEYELNFRFYEIEGLNNNPILCFESDSGLGGVLNLYDNGISNSTDTLFRKIYEKAVDYL